MLSRLRFLTAGESHGPRLTAILEGVPAGFVIDSQAINADLRRRQSGYGSGARMRIEKDSVQITSGIMGGQTMGGPIALDVANLDWKNWQHKDIAPMTIPRPGHADLTGTIKYGFKDLRLALERASARETTMRVAVGAICRQFLQAFDIEVGGYVVAIGEAMAKLDASAEVNVYRRRFAAAQKNDVACPDESAVPAMRQAIKNARKAMDTLGGIFEVVALQLPPGLGSYAHWDRRLGARLSMALLSIPAVKGIEFGPAFANAQKRGTKVHDEIHLADDGHLQRNSNHAGGLEGGISTGEPLLMRMAMKPLSTTLQPLHSVDLAAATAHPSVYQRSDFCAVPRAVPVGEAMAAIVLCDALFEKLGGDSLAEMRTRYQSLRRSHLGDLPMHNQPWRI